MIELDHIAVSGETLTEARDFVERSLGMQLQQGGVHDVFFTHNMLLGLEEGLYLEAIAVDPEGQKPNRPRWFDLDGFSGPPRLTNWICRTPDLNGVLQMLPETMGAPVELQRGDLKWRMAVPENGVLPFDNIAPALIEWQTPSHPAALLAPTGIKLVRLTARHSQADNIRALLMPHIVDDRVSFEVDSAASLVAEFQTPHGTRMIGA